MNIIDELKRDEYVFRTDTVKYALEHKDECIKVLMDDLEFIYNRYTKKDRFYYPVSYLYDCFILSELKVKESFELITKLFTNLNSDCDDFGDVVTEHLPMFLCSTLSEKDVKSIVKFISNKKLDIFVRCAFAEAYEYCIYKGYVSKDEAIRFYSGYLNKYIKKLDEDFDNENDDNVEEIFIMTMCDSIIRLSLYELVPIVKKLFNEEYISPDMSGHFDEYLSFKLNERFDEEKYFIIDTISELGNYAFFDEGSNIHRVDRYSSDRYDIEKDEILRVDNKDSVSKLSYIKCIREAYKLYPCYMDNTIAKKYYSKYNEDFIKLDKLLYKAIIPYYVDSYYKRKYDIENKYRKVYFDKAIDYLSEIIKKYNIKSEEELDDKVLICYEFDYIVNSYYSFFDSISSKNSKLEEIINYFDN